MRMKMILNENTSLIECSIHERQKISERCLSLKDLSILIFTILLSMILIFGYMILTTKCNVPITEQIKSNGNNVS